jgi:hypothetical protein
MLSKKQKSKTPLGCQFRLQQCLKGPKRTSIVCHRIMFWGNEYTTEKREETEKYEKLTKTWFPSLVRG